MLITDKQRVQEQVPRVHADVPGNRAPVLQPEGDTWGEDDDEEDVGLDVFVGGKKEVLQKIRESIEDTIAAMRMDSANEVNLTRSEYMLRKISEGGRRTGGKLKVKVNRLETRDGLRGLGEAGGGAMAGEQPTTAARSRSRVSPKQGGDVRRRETRSGEESWLRDRGTSRGRGGAGSRRGRGRRVRDQGVDTQDWVRR